MMWESRAPRKSAKAVLPLGCRSHAGETRRRLLGLAHTLCLPLLLRRLPAQAVDQRDLLGRQAMQRGADQVQFGGGERDAVCHGSPHGWVARMNSARSDPWRLDFAPRLRDSWGIAHIRERLP